MKVIYLAFADSAKEGLPFLKEEEEAVYDLLNARALAGDFVVYRQPNATPEKISAALQRYRDNLAIFHYSGHAGLDKLLVNDELIHSRGIADQLKQSVAKGVLKLVVLNGCSTFGQVSALKKIGVPAIVSTSAPVKDKSAKEFSIHFWKNLLAGMPIADACEQALGPANMVAATNVSAVYQRHLVFNDSETADADTAVWRLDGAENDILRYPIPVKPAWSGNTPVPNQALVTTLFNSFQAAGSSDIRYLWDKRQRGEVVGPEIIVSALLNNMPITIGIHLQKLLGVTITENEPSVLRKFWKERLFQIGQLYQTATEFFGIVLIAQVWELFIKFGNAFRISDNLKTLLSDYLGLNWEKRKVYDYIPLIREGVHFLGDDPGFPDNIRAFIKTQEILSDLYNLDDDFMESCDYLATLRKLTVAGRLDENQIEAIAQEGESNLCKFMAPLGFIHKYNLCSIQKIDIMKFKHVERERAQYLHKIVKCMQATTDERYNYYYMPSYVDNWSVMLIKFRVEQIIDADKGIYRVTPIDYLNLSPFVIDRNAFIEKANLSYIMFFKEMDSGTRKIQYQWVKKPMNTDDSFEVNDEQMYHVIQEQFDAFAQLTR